LKLDGTHQLLVYADDVNMLGGGTHPREKNTEAIVVASKEIGLEANSDKISVHGHVSIIMQDEFMI
jgi:hypothetical protein